MKKQTKQPPTQAPKGAEDNRQTKKGISVSTGTMPKNTPFVVNVKNLTDEKLYDVNLIDYEHEKQKKIEFSMGVSGVLYNEFLRQLQHKEITIDTTYIKAHCDYSKFEKRQLSCVLLSKTQDAQGHRIDKPMFSIIDPYQYQSNCVVINAEYPISYMSFLFLNYLMPETDITIFLFPKMATKKH